MIRDAEGQPWIEPLDAQNLKLQRQENQNIPKSLKRAMRIDSKCVGIIGALCHCDANSAWVRWLIELLYILLLMGAPFDR